MSLFQLLLCRYEKTTLEQLVASGGAQFDVVMASEVIEHVRHPQQFMADLAAATQPGGQVFITTLNRTPASYAMAVLLAERVVGLVPAGTHDWTKFITPQELAIMAADAGLKVGTPQQCTSRLLQVPQEQILRLALIMCNMLFLYHLLKPELRCQSDATQQELVSCG